MIWRGVCIHHSATKDTGSNSWDAIRRYHVETNKWSEIGYHFGVELLGDGVYLRIGRPTNVAGAHAAGLNSNYLGICVVGDYDKDNPTWEHLHVLAQLIRDLSTYYKFPLNRETLKYHSDVSMKTCPGENFPSKDILLNFIG